MITEKVTQNIVSVKKRVEVFKTDVEDVGQAMWIVNKLKVSMPGSLINFDLDDCDHILRIEAETISVQNVILWLNNCGYDCQVLV